MTESRIEEPWIELARLIVQGSSFDIHVFLDELPAGELGRVMDRLSEPERDRLLEVLGAREASTLVEDLPHHQAVHLLEHLRPQQVAGIVDELHSDEQADILGDLGRDMAEAVLDAMEPKEALQARELLVYSQDVAGGLMQTECLHYDQALTVQEVIDDLRARSEDYSDFDVQYTYVENPDGRLVGVLRMRDLLLAGPDHPLGKLMIRDPVSVDHFAPLNELQALFDEREYIGVPVVDGDHRLQGVVLRKAVSEATREEAAEDFLKVSGLQGREELRSMPLRVRSTRRLSWLSINIVLNVIAASVIAFYQETLAQVIALAVFLPIISDMSGCSGNQAVAVSIRELTLGLVRPREMVRVLVKEAAVGLVNGLLLGILIAAVAILWKGNPFLGLVVGAALMGNTLLAVCLGGLIPLVLKRFDLDPALASGPILTTVTDMCGFFFVLALASASLAHLV